MLGSEHPHGRRRKVEFGSDWRFVEASEEIRFAAENREQLYGWVERVLVGQGYAQQGSLKFQGVAGNSFWVDLNGCYVQRHESIRSAS